ncbi:Enhancer of polycomb-like protein 1 [Coemansia guatemalensis]|uniref:Enhancer of polycomb-like protein n=1 Tax=Coemansia guatemalensis TaxID=2761395 RepID=A0A9W8HQU7_9FUNG|nr:Enhancer of polycomb-like protein 1 [Coemansia guatemalensis]
MANAQRFRARKVDSKRQLPVYRATDLDDLDDDDNRQTDNIETGVEKDEEAEHHLQAAISATQAAASGSAPAKQVYIPTPDASKVADGYDKLYPKNFPCPTSLIRSSETVEECCAPMYCMDDEDMEWLEAHNKSTDSKMSMDEFEQVMDQLETVSRDMVFLRTEDIPSVDHLAALAADREKPFAQQAAEQVFTHWKRRREQREFKTVTAALQMEDTSKTEIDPYVCFRRREVRQGRKTRRADQRSLEQLRRLRINLAMAAQLLEMCVERENSKRETVEEAQRVARQRAEVLRMRRRLSISTGNWDDLFVPPQQPQQGQQRKRLNGRDSQRARAAAAAASTRRPRGSAGLSAIAGGAGSACGEATLPLPFVLPRTVAVYRYPVPRRQQSVGSRIQTKMHVCESRLATDGWVDATYGGEQLRRAYSDMQPVAAGFWAPRGLGSIATTALSPAQTPVAFRLRRGRHGRLFMDRRQVHARAVDEDRVMRYRLGLLRSEDHQRLHQCRGHIEEPSSVGGIPEDLLKPFSFTNLLHQQPTPPGLQQQVQAASAPLAAAQLSAAPTPLQSLSSASAVLPMSFGGTKSMQSMSPPLSATSGGSLLESLGTVPVGPSNGNNPASAAARAAAVVPAQHSGIDSSSGSSAQSPSAQERESAQLGASSTSIPLNMPVLVSSVGTPALSAMSPQLGNGSPATIPNAARCN